MRNSGHALARGAVAAGIAGVAGVALGVAVLIAQWSSPASADGVSPSALSRGAGAHGEPGGASAALGAGIAEGARAGSDSGADSPDVGSGARRLPEPGAADGRAPGISALPSAAWVAETAERLGIPPRALAAYAGAAMRLAGEQPECGIDWPTLAGIGEVESGHGKIFGGAIRPDGMQTPAVVGIPLDGTQSAAIPDSDGGALDGDPVWDRAVGPMQIIPDTWRRYAADGSGAGAPDPQQIDDASLTAARYLCAGGGDLRTDAGWIAAVAAYNDSVDYNHRVAEATSRYRAG